MTLRLAVKGGEGDFGGSLKQDLGGGFCEEPASNLLSGSQTGACAYGAGVLWLQLFGGSQ